MNTKQIIGTMNLGKIGAGTLILSNANSVTGTLSILGSSLNLRDDGTLLNVISVDVNYATLTFDNNASTQTQNNNRLNDAAAITLRGGDERGEKRGGGVDDAGQRSDGQLRGDHARLGGEHHRQVFVGAQSVRGGDDNAHE